MKAVAEIPLVERDLDDSHTVSDSTAVGESFHFMDRLPFKISGAGGFMKKIIFSAMALFLFVSPAFAEKDYITIDSFYWSARGKVFSYSGNSELPTGTQLKVTLLLNGHWGEVNLVEVTNRGWEGYFGPYNDKELAPGEYLLQVEAFESQSSPEIMKELEALKKAEAKLKVTKGHEYKIEEKEQAWEEFRKEIFDELMGSRVHFDTILQQGNRVLWKAKGLSPEAREKLGQAWYEIYATLPDFKQKQADLAQKHKRLLIHPYQEAMNRFIAFLELMQQMKHSMASKVSEATGVPMPDKDKMDVVLELSSLTRNIIDSAKQIFTMLGYQGIYWGPKVKLGKDNIRYNQVQSGNFAFRSSTSRFGFECPRFPKELLAGEKESPERLTMVYEIFTMPAFILQVQMVHFPGFEAEEEKIKAWELLASYEWEGYRKESGAYIDVVEEVVQGQPQKPARKIYEFVFISQTRTMMRRVKCYLFFSPKEKDLVYGLLYINLLGSDMQGHTSVEDIFQVIMKTFKIF